jgi:hypothetical protein
MPSLPTQMWSSESVVLIDPHWLSVANSNELMALVAQGAV